MNAILIFLIIAIIVATLYKMGRLPKRFIMQSETATTIEEIIATNTTETETSEETTTTETESLGFSLKKLFRG